MPAVRGLEDYLRTLEIVEPRPLHELQETIIGVDVFQWLRSNNFINREALHSALGGLPITLEQQVHQQLFEFHKWRIHPLFVFNGLKYSQNARAPFSSSRSRKYAAKRKQAWKSMENNNISKAIDLFSQISGYVSISAQDDLIRIFSRWNAMIPSRNKSLEGQYLSRLKSAETELEKSKISLPNYFQPLSWIRAPYYAASQMAYLESHEEMLHAVCGGCDLLMFGGEKVILNIDFDTASYEVTDLDQVLFALRVDTNPYCFIDTCLLSGFDASRTFEPLTYNNKLTSLKQNDNNNNNSDNDMNNRRKKRKNIRRNFSYEYSLEQVLKKGNGISVINDYLCTFNDTGSSSSYNSNYSASTITSIGNKSTRSMQSIGNKSTRSIGNRSALNMRIYQQKHKQLTNRNASGNIDKILQHMLIENENINGSKNQELATLNEDKSNNIANLKDIQIIGGGEDEQKENPKYREYLNLYLIVRDRVCNAKVLSFNGETQIYKPFKWMNEQLLKLKKSQLKQQKGKKEVEQQQQQDNDDDDRKYKQQEYMQPMGNKCDDNIPSNVYRLLGVGILRTFLPSAILGGHLIDTTPLIDSEELETCMNSLLPLREKILNIFQTSFNTSNKISLQRWFQPNRDQILNYNHKYSSIWVENFQYCLNVIFNEKVKPIVKSQAIALITPLKMLSEIENNRQITNQLFKHGKTSLNKNDIFQWKIPKISHISQVLTAAYCGTLITLDLISKNNKLNIIAKCLSKINKFEFETVLAIEMLKNKDLNAKIFTLIDENGKAYQIENNYGGPPHLNNNNLISKKKTLRLLSRICSILPMRPFIDGKKPWMSKLSHSLAAFNHIVTSYHNSLKNCIESSITWLYCQQPLNDIMVTPIFLKELALSLKQLPPEPCIGVGVLIYAFINNFQLLNWNEISNTMNDKNKYELLKDQLDLLTKQFPVFTRIHFAIQCCMQFFYQICTLVKELGDNNILNQQVVVQFEDAYEYLRELGVWDAIYFMEIQHNKKH